MTGCVLYLEPSSDGSLRGVWRLESPLSDAPQALTLLDDLGVVVRTIELARPPRHLTFHLMHTYRLYCISTHSLPFVCSRSDKATAYGPRVRTQREVFDIRSISYTM